MKLPDPYELQRCDVCGAVLSKMSLTRDEDPDYSNRASILFSVTYACGAMWSTSRSRKSGAAGEVPHGELTPLTASADWKAATEQAQCRNAALTVRRERVEREADR